jgi:predicted TPR repeat methyltransferase
VATDPTDVLGASLKRDLLRSRPVAESMPPAFVEQLFDGYAERFDAALVERLGYCGPQILVEQLRASGFSFAGRALDLGCGTGLSGQALRPFCGRLEGVDISAGMLRRAAQKGIYDALSRADIQTLPIAAPPYDLIAAADVFIYLGALETIIAWCAASLRPGGRLVFTVEAGDSAPVRLLESRRFAHSQAYVEGLLASAGFTGVSVAEAVLRTDRGAPVCAYAVCATAPGAQPDLEGDGEAEAVV